MKDYRRTYPLFSLCGLNCALCPIHHMQGGCPGCGGGAGHQSCPIARCARDRGGLEHCFLCGDYPCERYEGVMDYDSFLPHRNMARDMELAGRMGLEAYRAVLEEKAQVLTWLLAEYNDGRRKSLFCAAACLLELEDLKLARRRIRAQTGPEMTRKERSTLAVRCLGELARERGVCLRLRRRQKGEPGRKERTGGFHDDG